MIANRKLSKLEKKTWAEMRTRLKKALEEEKSISKRDLNVAYQLHRGVYGKPTTRPGINCCIDIATWLEIVKNNNAAFVVKS